MANKKRLAAGVITGARLTGVRFQVEVTPEPNVTQRALVPLLNERGLMPQVGDVYEVTIKLKNAKEQMRKSNT